MIDPTSAGYKPVQGRRFLRPGETINMVFGIMDVRTKYPEKTDSLDNYSVYVVLGNKLDDEDKTSIVDSFRNMIKAMVP